MSATTTSPADPVVPARRLALETAAPQALKAMYAFSRSVVKLDERLRHLVDIRASQINGCAYCLEMHLREARKAGESEQRLDTVAGWRDAPFFTARERAAFALTEAMTLISARHVPDDVWEEAARQFDEEELGNLLMRITAINSWNRLMIATRTPPQER
jgi:AhpD family alkylhydroperoxidase